METTAEEQKQSGQTTTVYAKADYSQVACLDPLTSVMVKQPIRTGELLCEMFCGCEMQNFYEILSVDPQAKTTTPLFTLMEDSNCCLRQCCGAQRPLVLNAKFPDRQEDEASVFEIVKPYRMGCICCPATNCMGRNYMEVVIGGVMIGSIREQCLCNCKVKYGVFDEADNELCSLERCACYCECMDVSFEILTPQGEETGKKVTKVFGGMMKEMFTTNDQFSVEFPDFMNTLQRKLLMIGAAMMIEFRHFEQKKK